MRSSTAENMHWSLVSNSLQNVHCTELSRESLHWNTAQSAYKVRASTLHSTALRFPALRTNSLQMFTAVQSSCLVSRENRPAESEHLEVDNSVRSVDATSWAFFASPAQLGPRISALGKSGCLIWSLQLRKNRDKLELIFLIVLI